MRECPFCYKDIDSKLKICPNCDCGLPKGTPKGKIIHGTSFNPGGDKATATDLSYQGGGNV